MPGAPLYPPEMVDTKTITLKRLKEVHRAEVAYEKLVQRDSWVNAATHAVLEQMFSKLPKNLETINAERDYQGDRQQMHRNLMFLGMRVDWPMLMKKADLLRPDAEYSQGITDDMEAALGGFSFFAAVDEALIMRNHSNRNFRLVKIQAVSFYMMNPYSFYDRPGTSQYLGHWNKTGMFLVPDPRKEKDDTAHWANFPVYRGNDMYAKNAVMYPIHNRDYRQWQDKHNQGGDMLLFSDYKTIGLWEPIEFLIPA